MPWRISISCGLLAVGFTAGAAIAAAQELRDEPGPSEQRANAITPENPIPRRTIAVTPLYPPAAAAIDATARVTLHVTLDDIGRVDEIRRSSLAPLVFPGTPATPAQLATAAEALVVAAADAVRQWQYDRPVRPPISFSVTIGFRPGVEPAIESQGRVVEPGVLTGVPARAPGVSNLPPAPWAEGAVRVGSGMRFPTRLVHVPPVYPPDARANRVQGVVILEARIDADGRVSHARVIRSIPELDQAALDAVLQWQYEPTLLNGVPVPVVMTVTMNFSLR